MDMGAGRSRNKYAYQNSDDENDSTESDSQATTDDDTEDEARAEVENALVQSALARIRKAQAKGKQDVRLNKEELAALERRRKRLQAEADARKRGTDRKRPKEKEKRFSIPLSQLDPPLAGRGGPSTSDDALPRHPLPSTMLLGQVQPSPPIGLFPPPGASQIRTRSSASSSLRASSLRQDSSSPFEYQYVSPHPTQRHASDTPRATSSRTSIPREADWPIQLTPSPRIPDPFLYQTAGDDDTGSDGLGHGARIARDGSRENVIVVESGSEPEPEPEPEPLLTRSKAKRKPVGGGRKRKGK